MALLPKQQHLYLPELFEAVQKAPDRMTRQNMLVEYAQKDELHMRTLMAFTQLAFHPHIVFEIPEGTPPYLIPTKVETEAPNNLFKAFREMGRFLRGDGNLIQNQVKRQDYFITILESLSERESKLLIAIKDKKVNELYSKITIDLFCQVFGGAGWLPKEVVDANPPKQDDEKKTIAKKQKTSSTDSTED